MSAVRGTLLFANLENQKELDAAARRWSAAFKRTGEQIRELRPAMETEQDKRDLARFESGLSEFGKVSADYIRLCGERKLQEAAGLLPKVEAFATLADESLNSLKDQQRKVLKDSQARAESLRSQSLLVSIFLSGVLLAIVVLAVYAVRGINRTLVTALGQLSEGAGQVAASAGQVSSSSRSLAQGSSEQAASLEETSASSEEINSMARKNSENSRRRGRPGDPVAGEVRRDQPGAGPDGGGHGPDQHPQRQDLQNHQGD